MTSSPPGCADRYGSVLKATGRLLRAAPRDSAHTKAAFEALGRLPAVVTERRRLPARVEQSLAVLEAQ